jgi:hypothetical protein
MAYRFAMQAVEACERRLAFDDALGWLDFASGVATTATDADAVNRATAHLLEISDRRELPPARAPVGALRTIAAAEFDISARD